MVSEGGAMSKFSNRLDDVKVAAPCPANWDAMSGNDRVRFCSQCNLNVYNLSGMSRNEAASFVNRTEDRVCIRYYRRADGSILTDNCPVGLRALKRRAIRVAKAVLSSVICFLVGMSLYRVVPLLEVRVMVMEEERVVVMGTMAAREIRPSAEPLSPGAAELGTMEMGRATIGYKAARLDRGKR
jgi:hypothetical protein